MLPDETSKLINQLAAPILATVRTELNRKWTLSAEQSAAAGVAGSGVAFSRIAMVHIEHYKELAEQLWQCIRRVVLNTGLSPYPELAEDLKRRFDELIVAPASHVESGLRDLTQVGVSRSVEVFQGLRVEVQQKYHTEIELLTHTVNSAHARHQKEGSMVTVTNTVAGDNARVNINSTDNSINTKNSDTVFKELVAAIQDRVLDATQKEALVASLEAIEAAKPERNRMWAAYRDFIALAGDHFSVISPFLPALTRLLTG